MKQEKIVLGAGTKYPLNGMLTLPEGKGQFPAVVFVHGSGSSNMDEKVGRLTPFKDLAEGLAKHGIASLRYDKRSFAHGLKMVLDRKLTITVKEETVEDAILAAELLRADPRIDPEKIFVVGHSMGAMLAPRIDAEGGNFHGLILMAGTLRRLEEVLLEQSREVLGKMNPLLRRIAGGQIRKMEELFADIDTVSDEEAKKRKAGGGTTLYYFREINAYPTAECLKQSDKPILIMQGTEDVQVSVEKDFEGYRQLLQGRENVTFKLYEGLNHAFVPSVYGDLSKVKQEYNVEQRIGENVIADLAEWIFAYV